MKFIDLQGGYRTCVDDADYTRLSLFVWRAFKPKRNNTPYAVMKNGRDFIFMHKFIMGFTGDLEVDHIDGDTLNNCRENLRLTSHRQNIANSKKFKSFHGAPCLSKYKGVTYRKDSNRWRARIRDNNISINLGHFNTEIDAARAYDAKAKELFGEFARLNNV